MFNHCLCQDSDHSPWPRLRFHESSARPPGLSCDFGDSWRRNGWRHRDAATEPCLIPVVRVARFGFVACAPNPVLNTPNKLKARQVKSSCTPQIFLTVMLTPLSQNSQLCGLEHLVMQEKHCWKLQHLRKAIAS